MCRLYTKHGKPAYIRLCCRTGRAGYHLSWSDNFDLTLWTDGFARCVPGNLIPGGRKTRKAKITNPLHFSVPRPVPQSDIDDMARYAHADAIVSESGLQITLRFQIRHGYPSAVIDRARSFGWKLEEEVGDG